jgi:hypothetical protein
MAGGGGYRVGLGRFEEDEYFLLLTHESFRPDASRCTNWDILVAQDIQVVPEGAVKNFCQMGADGTDFSGSNIQVVAQGN